MCLLMNKREPIFVELQVGEEGACKAEPDAANVVHSAFVERHPRTVAHGEIDSMETVWYVFSI